MDNLETTYMNLKLKNPIIVASSGLTNSAAKIVDCEKAGAGAVVVKSLFEEVLTANDNKLIIDQRRFYLGSTFEKAQFYQVF